YSRIEGLGYLPEKVVKTWRNQTIYNPPSDAELAVFKLAYRNVCRFLMEFHNAGGRVLAGSAARNHVSRLGMQREMETLVELGLSPAEVIEIATRLNAEFLRQDAEIGTIAPQKLADIIIVDGNPLLDINNIRRLSWVIKDGEVVDRSYHSGY